MTTAQLRDRPALVSVVIAVHNGLPLILEQLDAITAQKVDVPFEVVIADNGSTDGSAEQCIRHCLSGEVRVIDASDRRGKAFAVRAGVLEAKGDLIVIADQDDICAPNWLQSLVDTAPSYDVVGGRLDLTTLNSDEVVRSRPWIMMFAEGLPTSPGSGVPYAVGCNVAIWRDVFEALEIGAEELPGDFVGEDRERGLRLKRMGRSLGYTQGAVVYYRLRGDGKSLRRQLQAYGRSDALLAKRFADLGERGDSFGSALRKWCSLAPRAAKAALEGDDLHWARAELAVAIGRLKGSFRYKVLCL